MEISFSRVPERLTDILAAETIGAGFEGTVEEKDRLVTYIRATDYREQIIRDIIIRYSAMSAITWEVRLIREQNWNALWESNYEPVMIAGRVYVRAPFHQELSAVSSQLSASQDIPPEGNASNAGAKQNAKRAENFEIIIEPKMSFGTAHHETTAMMVEYILEEEVEGKKVLDMGCGTGILAILCARMGASEVVAIDNDDWAIINATENAGKNKTPRITVIQGDAGDIPGKDYHLILANINRNVLLDQIPAYTARTIPGGRIILSGFLTDDLEMISEQAGISGLNFVDRHQKNNWVAARFSR
jgi:ribosomal protein L11 methyltransferase